MGVISDVEIESVMWATPSGRTSQANELLVTANEH